MQITAGHPRSYQCFTGFEQIMLPATAAISTWHLVSTKKIGLPETQSFLVTVQKLNYTNDGQLWYIIQYRTVVNGRSSNS